MQEVKFDKKEFKFSFGSGKECVMRMAYKFELDEFAEELEKKPKEETAITKALYEKLGMQEEVFEYATPEELLQVGLIVTSQKKI